MILEFVTSMFLEVKKKTLWPLFMDGVQVPQAEISSTNMIDLQSMKG